ncbi:MAG: histidine kinase [Bacteroidota bacterium]
MPNKPSILYVDDEHQNLVSFKATFRPYYHIHIAHSGLEAIDILKQSQIDLIITDQRMPNMTGVQLFETILTEFPDPIRMVLTGYSDVEAIINAINKGKVYYYVTKPWNEKELKLIIDNALEAYRLKQENKQLVEEKNQLQVQAERQAKENILSRYETLKNQVNPHFLFNCLNTLSSLIYEDPTTAETFVSRLTKVYRYVLDQREEITVMLEEEITCMKHYVFLQQVRFSDRLSLTLEIPSISSEFFIPPLTLQMLVENAIKHNIVSKEFPLHIHVYEEKSYLVVKNSFQPRTEKVTSTGMGLQNLRERYAFLSDEQPSFYQEEGHYYAKVPLLSQHTDKQIYQD